ncbi:helix-turn-helix protein [Azospirillum brasilense]|uniref:Helix-turn-helix domain-containing protein n=1 Tax=Azospirillum baldaniorum TaxID=1064539 RepID=A0A9P1JT81_9PROT|nr:helix-turn-helix domain-containing protein [Azospirillum baldaniorum]TWA73377.1 helix-turn-helix protein [Azospirillum brasilense]CCC99376.1 protein of unknown function [Azospirillum baldaniorum]
MSFRLQSIAWDAPFAGNVKLVLLRLCHFADDDGANVFPTVGRVAKDCGISERTTQEAIRAIEATGVLVMVKEADAGAKRAREYRIDVAALEALVKGDGCEICTGAKSARVQKTTVTGAKSAPNPIIEPINPPPAETGAGAKPKAQFIVVGEHIASLTGWDRNPNWLGNYGRVVSWLKSGWDPDLDIYPTVERVMARRSSQGPPGGLEYFERAIADAHANRTKPIPEGAAHVQRDPLRSPRQQPANRFQDLLDAQLAGRA